MKKQKFGDARNNFKKADIIRDAYLKQKKI